jgi:membrane protease YdiL (CAAX protease family)
VSAGLGLLIAGFIVLVYFITLRLGWIDPASVRTRADATGLNNLRLYLAGAVYWITLNSLMEEYVWRWFVYRQFEVLLGGPGAIFASALAFTAHHVIAMAGQFDWLMTVLGSFGVFVGGAVWGWLFQRYRSVWPCYVSHAIVDVPIFVIGYWLIFESAGGG